MRNRLMLLSTLLLVLTACGAAVNPTATPKTPDVPIEEALLNLEDIASVSPEFASQLANPPKISQECMVQELDCTALSYQGNQQPTSAIGIEVTTFADDQLTTAGDDAYQKFLANYLGDNFTTIESEILPAGSWYLNLADTIFLGVPYHNLFLLFAIDTQSVESLPELVISLAEKQVEKLERGGY
jgi:hypothetical protein